MPVGVKGSKSKAGQGDDHGPLAVIAPKKAKPERLRADVWTVLEEYHQQGGLFDMAEDIASLASIENEVRGDKNIPLARRAELIARLAGQRAEIKMKYTKAQEAKKNYLPLTDFSILVKEMGDIVFEEVKDAPTVARIGNRWGLRLQATLMRIRGG